MKLYYKRSFTLVETLIACVILMLVIQAIYTTFHIGQTSWAHYSNNTLRKQELRKALFFLTRELREAKDVFIVKKDNELSVSFNIPLKGEIRYSWSDQGEKAFQIIRRNYSRSMVIAGRISYFSLEHPKSNEIILWISSDTIKLKQKITIRSKTKTFLHSNS